MHVSDPILTDSLHDAEALPDTSAPVKSVCGILKVSAAVVVVVVFDMSGGRFEEQTTPESTGAEHGVFTRTKHI